MGKLGKYVQGMGSIPSGSDAAIVFPILTAGLKPILVTVGSWYGGDANEYIQIGMINSSTNSKLGAKSWDEWQQDGNGVSVFGGNLAGNDFSAQLPGTMFGNYIRSPMGTAGFYLPPNYTLVMWASAANTNAWYATMGGFECEDYA